LKLTVNKENVPQLLKCELFRIKAAISNKQAKKNSNSWLHLVWGISKTQRLTSNIFSRALKLSRLLEKWEFISLFLTLFLFQCEQKLPKNYLCFSLLIKQFFTHYGLKKISHSFERLNFFLSYSQKSCFFLKKK